MKVTNLIDELFRVYSMNAKVKFLENAAPAPIEYDFVRIEESEDKSEVHIYIKNDDVR